MHDVIVEKLLGLIEGDELRQGHPNAISEEDTEESPTKSGRNLVTDGLRILEVGHRVDDAQYRRNDTYAGQGVGNHRNRLD